MQNSLSCAGAHPVMHENVVISANLSCAPAPVKNAMHRESIGAPARHEAGNRLHISLVQSCRAPEITIIAP
jgi:hypothetical protein